MPTYTYECKKCGHTQDMFHGISQKPRVKCEECSGACKKLMGSGSGLIFKGSGFYETDYKNKGRGKKDGGKKDGGSGSGSDSGSDSGKSESVKSDSTSGDSNATKSTSSDSKSNKGADKKPAAASKGD